ncbi:hypothetical protein CPB86DRAFT_799760 [Serendipita vermifera]|nr:hypothetical protein CPB86DRAFT_799760 [Serendipita vermifera]
MLVRSLLPALLSLLGTSRRIISRVGYAVETRIHLSSLWARELEITIYLKAEKERGKGYEGGGRGRLQEKNKIGNYGVNVRWYRSVSEACFSVDSGIMARFPCSEVSGGVMDDDVDGGGGGLRYRWAGTGHPLELSDSLIENEKRAFASCIAFSHIFS